MALALQRLPFISSSSVISMTRLFSSSANCALNSATSSSVRLLLAIELRNSLVFLCSRPLFCIITNVDVALKTVSRSTSYSLSISRASFITVSGEFRSCIFTRISASYASTLPVCAEKIGWKW